MSPIRRPIHLAPLALGRMETHSPTQTGHIYLRGAYMTYAPALLDSVALHMQEEVAPNLSDSSSLLRPGQHLRGALKSPILQPLKNFAYGRT
ncbi:hypothetical protein BDZ94DRAFT_1259732 [Collybia nuda]|uniref:Uncharacterized protein n=1 Tax=Collybia nuda TaxID=64659 RepID=A0A9P6CJS4_9AGAR|nr:hypothetical protein BDZ94DRAFT_1259732 [Collybia nuda]